MANEMLDRLEDMGAEVEDTLERLMGDEAFYVECLKKLPDNPNIVELRKAVQARDSERATREVHTLKGVALNLGLLPLVDVCMDMLLDFRAGKTDAAFAQMGEVDRAFQEWADAVGED
ncbi:MAG: Hpt domain-containing protein [Eubacteriales bacterium]|nr:Hpt domain-containing protein [Eubacteriales bacterium]